MLMLLLLQFRRGRRMTGFSLGASEAIVLDGFVHAVVVAGNGPGLFQFRMLLVLLVKGNVHRRSVPG